jgi:hypothetical protein
MLQQARQATNTYFGSEIGGFFAVVPEQPGISRLPVSVLGLVVKVPSRTNAMDVSKLPGEGDAGLETDCNEFHLVSRGSSTLG